MDAARFEKLLYEEEGTSLDFKRDQYAFAKASDEEKSELLKDILGFVNAWRRSEAFILIGVDEVRGGRSDVVGITEHLQDHSLQQFVNNLTNRPVQFSYEVFSFEGHQVGIIRIQHQPRPVYLKRNYGKLEKDKVYVRRGSSTDRMKPAGPDEIAQMGRPTVSEQAELDVQFAASGQDVPQGHSIKLESEFCAMPSKEAIPDVGTVFPTLRQLERPNPGYLRQMAEFVFIEKLMRPIRIVVENTGEVGAPSVRVEVSIEKSEAVLVRCWGDMPQRPQRRHWDLLMSGIGPQRQPDERPGRVSVVKTHDEIKIAIECDNLQPGRKVWSEPLFVGRTSSGVLEFRTRVFADNLSQPVECTLKAELKVSHSQMNLGELQALPDALEAVDPTLLEKLRDQPRKRLR